MHTEEIMEVDQAEVLAVLIAINNNRMENCDITVYTDRMIVAKRADTKEK